MMSMSKLYECMKRKKINNSHAREVIYDVLIQADNCMSVTEIIKQINLSYHRKISLNTIYRHLTLFVDCGLAVVIQDDHKKAYYFITGDKAKIFCLCLKCNYLSVMDDSAYEKMLVDLDKNEFITIHKRCEKCR